MVCLLIVWKQYGGCGKMMLDLLGFFFQEKAKLFKKYLVQDFIFGYMDVKCLNNNNLLVFFNGGSWTNYLHYVTVPCKCQSLHAQTENQIYLLIK